MCQQETSNYPPVLKRLTPWCFDGAKKQSPQFLIDLPVSANKKTQQEVEIKID